MKNKISFTTVIMAVFLLLSSIASAASAASMVSKYTNWNYGDSSERFTGYVPALDKFVDKNPWQLAQWSGLYTFADGKTRTVSNYDVFNIKKTPEDEDFDKENGFGLVFKSKAALSDLFDSIWAGQTGFTSDQREYFRDKFSNSADDPAFTSGNMFFYTVSDHFSLLRTSGLFQRMGIQFNKAQKATDGTLQALYDVSSWPELSVAQGSALNISFSSYGYSERDIRLIAAPKGDFPNLTNVVSLTDGKLIHTSETAYTSSVTVNAGLLIS